MEYEAMDEDITQPSSNMIPIALAVLGILLGMAGLYFGFSANKRLNSIDTSIRESSTSTAEIAKSVTFYDSQIAELEEQILEQSELLQNLRVYKSQSEQAIKTLSSELNKNREQIIKMAKQHNELKTAVAQTGTSPSALSSQSARVSNNAIGMVTGSEAERSTYVIAPGDTFARIASKLDVPLQAIIDANPDVDPRRLAIGQKIVIPIE